MDDKVIRMLFNMVRAGASGEIKDFLQMNTSYVNCVMMGFSLLYIAALFGKFQVAKVLLEFGANVDFVSDDGFTPLYAASQEGHVQVVIILLRYRADMEKTNTHGQTALWISAWRNHHEIVGLLIANGANAKHEDRLGRTPLDIILTRRFKLQLELGNIRLSWRRCSNKLVALCEHVG